MIQWGKYEEDKDKTGLPGSVWELTKTGEGGWTQEITDNTKAVEGIALYNDNDEVTNGSLTVNEGDTLQLIPKVSPDDATQDVTWESSDPTAAEVQDGHVTVLHAPADGQPVIITATTVDTNASGDRLSAYVSLTIQQVALKSLTLQYNGQTAPSEISTTVGNNITLTATADPISLQSSITWDSSDKTVATVANGVVTPLKAGQTTIWAKCKDDQTKWKSVEIKVSEPVVSTSTDIYVKWTDKNSAKLYYFAGATNNDFPGEPMTQITCNGDRWYKFTVPMTGKFTVIITGNNNNNDRYTATIDDKNVTDIPIEGTRPNYYINGWYRPVEAGIPSGCPVTRSAARNAVSPQVNSDAELASAPKSDAEDAASLQTFRKARLANA